MHACIFLRAHCGEGQSVPMHQAEIMCLKWEARKLSMQSVKYSGSVVREESARSKDVGPVVIVVACKGPCELSEGVLEVGSGGCVDAGG